MLASQGRVFCGDQVPLTGPAPDSAFNGRARPSEAKVDVRQSGLEGRY